MLSLLVKILATIGVVSGVAIGFCSVLPAIREFIFIPFAAWAGALLAILLITIWDY